jgi:hypothetical protein
MHGTQKWLRKSKELFSYYSKVMDDHGYTVTEINHPKYGWMIKDCFDCGLTLVDMKELIDFAVSNWESLKDVDRLLSEKPSLYEMFAGWRFPKWIKFSREGFVPKKNDDIKEMLKCIKKI